MTQMTRDEIIVYLIKNYSSDSPFSFRRDITGRVRLLEIDP